MWKELSKKIPEFAVQAVFVVVAAWLGFLAASIRDSRQALENSNDVWSIVLQELSITSNGIREGNDELIALHDRLARILAAESADDPVFNDLRFSLPREIAPGGAWQVALESDYTPDLDSGLLLCVAQTFDFLRLHEQAYSEATAAFRDFDVLIRVYNAAQAEDRARLHPVIQKGVVATAVVGLAHLLSMRLPILQSIDEVLRDERWPEEVRQRALIVVEPSGRCG